jgi:alpha-ketoglutarate-dependent taurine dioxygenase
MRDVVGIEVTPLSAACGAEIKGVDLTSPLPTAAVEAIRQAQASSAGIPRPESFTG